MTERGMSPNVRELALDALLLILEEGQYCHLVVRQALEKYRFLSAQERSFFTRLVQGTTERKIELDWIIGQYSKLPPDRLKPLIRNILRLTAYQLYYMDSVPVSAACNEAVKLTVKRGFSGLKGFVNGVCRSIARGRNSLPLPENWSIRYSMPDWIIQKYKQCAGSRKTGQILKNLLTQEKGELTVHCHTEKQPMKKIMASLERQQVMFREDDLLPEVLHIRTTELTSLTAFREGWIQVQNISSILACMAAAPQPGSICVDVCAAPGGKSIFLASAMNNQGQIFSRDISDAKTDYIRENAARCGFTCIQPQVWDAEILDKDMVGRADLVFADLPCSGLGVIGSKPDIKYHQTPEGAEALAALQRRILQVVQEYIKPGGILLFSTCTVNPEENIRNRDWFLSRFAFEAEDIQPYLPETLRTDTAKNGYLQLMPGEIGGDGFFFARMRRK